MKMNSRIPSLFSPVKRRSAARPAQNGSPHGLTIDVHICTSDPGRAAAVLIEQSATLLETNAELLEETACSISQSSASHTFAATQLVQRANALRLNASRMKQRAAVFANGSFPTV